MTTIVVNNNKVYADGQSTAGMITSYNVKKIANIGSCIVAGAGRWSHCLKFRQWVADMMDATNAQHSYPHLNIPMPEKMVADDFTGLVVYPDGVVVQFEGCDDFFEVEQPVFIGSGADYAAGAIHAGADGVRAIEIASKLDPYTGGEIQVEGFEEDEEPYTREDFEGMDKEDILNILFGDDTFDENSQDHILCLEDVQTTDNIDDLKSAAKSLNIKYSHNIGIETLRGKILKFLEN